MQEKFEIKLKHIFLFAVAVLFFNFTAISQCTANLKTAPTLLQGCEDFTVQFYDSTFTDPSVCIIQRRRWRFGDGTPTTGTQNPVHVYSAGVLGDTTYTAWLAIQDQFNDWDSMSVNVTVFKKPIAAFDLAKDTVCALESFCTTNNSETGSGYVYRWDFETGISASYDTCYQFDADGDYIIRLNVTDNQGCISSIESQIAVNEIPNPDFTITPFSGCNPLRATFANTTNPGTFPITGWSWDFAGYGSSTSEQPANINFPDPGLFQIKLSAVNSAGCENTTINNFLVRETPTASIAFDPEACVDENIVFLYTGSGTPAAEYEWTFTSALRDNEVGQGPILTAWDTGGEFEVKLVVTENACSDTAVENIQINDLPIVTLTSDAPRDSICEFEPITFTANPDSFVSYQFFNFGTLIQDSVINSITTDTLSSPNEITVIAVDSNSCASTASSNIEVVVLPKPSTFIFSSDPNDTICKGESVTFNAIGNFDSYQFFDGFLSLQNGPSSSFTSDNLEPNNRIYSIATDLGCVGFPSNQIQTTVIDPLPKPQLNCGESTTNSVSWSWESIDGALGYEISIDGGPFENPNNGLGYFKPGMFFGDSAKAVVIALGDDPCGNSIISDTITCIAIPCEEISFTPSIPPSYCSGDSVEISITNINTLGAFQISFNDSLYTDSVNSFIGFNDTIIEAQIIDFGQPGCPVFSNEFEITVNPIPTFNLLLSVDTVCKNDQIIAESDTAGYENYFFTVNGATVQDSALHILTTAFGEDSDKEIILTATEKGCTFSDSVSLYVIPTPPNNLRLLSDSLCEGEVATFVGTEGYVRYEFSRFKPALGKFETFLDSTINIYEVFAGTDEDIIVGLTAYDQNGCSSLKSIDTALVNALPRVEIDFVPDSVCEGESIRIVSNTSSFDEYKLFENFFQIGLNDSGNFVINEPENNKFYFVQATNNNCVGPLSNQLTGKISAPIDIPEPNCATTGNGRIDFVWDPIVGATSYSGQVRATNGTNLTTAPFIGSSYSITGLTAGDTAWAQFRALSGTVCGPTELSSEIFCIMPCAGVSFTKDPSPAKLCAGDSIVLSISNINTSEAKRLIQFTGQPFGKTTTTTYTNLTPGTKNYIVSVADTSQPLCPAVTKTFNVVVSPYPNVALNGPTSICGDTAIQFVASPRNYDRYAFYDGFVKIQDSINPEVIDFEVENGRSYRVVATNNGCSDTSNSITIDVAQPLEIPDLWCGESGLDSLTVNWDSVPNASNYQISINSFPWRSPNGDFEHVVYGLQPEDSVTFEIRAIGELPCGPGLRSQKVFCVAKPCRYKDFTFPSDTMVCEGDSITIEAINPISISNQRGFSYNRGASFTNDSRLTIAPSSDVQLQLRMVDSTELQCPFIEKFIKINVHPIPEFVLDNSTENDTVCEGEIIIFTADTAGFDIYQTYINGILVLDTNYFEFRTDSLGNGIQKIYMTAFDDICFFTSDTQIVNVVSFPELILTSSDSDLEICEQDTVVFAANSGFDSYNYYQILNNDTTLLRSGADSAFVTNNLINESTIYVEGINANTCSKTTANFDFIVNPIPKPILTSTDIDNIICGLDTLTFTVSPDTLDGYQFYNNTQLVDFGGASYITDTLRPGNVIYAIVTEDGCSNSTDTITTSVEFTPAITTSLDTNEICLGDTIKLWVTGGDEKIWSTGATTDTIVIAPELLTNYWVVGKTGNCTSPADTFIIDIDDDIPMPFAGEDTTICIGDSLELLASGGFTYKWFPQDSVTDPNNDLSYATVTTSQHIKLQAKNTHCIREDSLLLTIDLCLTELPDGIPNGLTPNGDGTNDSWDVPFIWYFTNNNIKIYNRWSNLVFKQNYYQGDWEGTNRNGNPLPDGTYFYVLDLGNGREPYLGYIIIHR